MGANSSLQMPSWEQGRAMEVNSPDITISGLKIEVKPEEKKKKGK